MVRTKVFCKVTDSDADPFIEQKDVILCRSGIQMYHKSELQGFMAGGNEPPVDKEWYKEYRPASVVVKAQKKCRSLPVTEEHPADWVTPNNFSQLAGGVTDREVSVVALEGEAEGEIGLKSNLTFYTKELYDYYKDNKEVSLGYTCKKHWVDNPEEVGYDIILDEITEVNHLAITHSGRGGEEVRVIDHILGGLRPMRTGIFAWLAGKKQKDSELSFGAKVISAVKDSKGTTEEELAKEMKCVLDSCSILKDCEAKGTLIDVVKDCFDNKDKALANEQELTATLDSMYTGIVQESTDAVVKAFTSLAVKDSADEKKEEEKTADSDEKKDEEKSEDSADEKKDGCNKDSMSVNKDALLTELTDSLKPVIQSVVKEVLGIAKDSASDIKGSEIDNATKDSACRIDYSDFLEK